MDNSLTWRFGASFMVVGVFDPTPPGSTAAADYSSAIASAFHELILRYAMQSILGFLSLVSFQGNETSDSL